MNKKEIIGYTSGVFDIFHIGHLNILKNAKGLCDRLIVGVSTDELVKSYKGKEPILLLQERLEIIRNLKFVDAVVTQTTLDKFEIWETIKYDIFIMGDDWIKAEDRQEQINKLNKVGVRTVFLPRTQRVSTTSLLKKIETNFKNEQENTNR